MEADEGHTSLFGGLSLSSLDSADDGGASEDDVSTHTELCQRLRELDEITSSFLDTRPLLLSSAYSSYLDLEPGQTQELKLVLPNFSVIDVLAITVACLNGACQDGISLSLQQQRQTPEGVYRSSIIPFSGGEISTFSTAGTCDATFSAADGIVKGTYFVKLTNLSKQQAASSKQLQLRIQYQVSPCVRANPIETDETISGAVPCHQFAFFRYCLRDASKLLSICCVQPDVSKGNAGCEIFVTNRYHGLVGVDRATAQWSSQTGYARVDIHPKDEKASLGSTFVIGIVGYGDVNQYELTVQLRDPSHIQTYAVGDSLPVTVQPGQSNFFALRVDTRVPGRITLRLLPSGSNTSDILRDEVAVDATTGRCVYGMDWLGQSADVFAIAAALPVMYFSAVVMYPSDDAYTWRISADPRNSLPCCVALETDDWRYTSETCYFSIFGLGNSSAQFTLCSYFRPDNDHLSDLEKGRHQWFEQIFGGIDGSLASQKDRTKEGLAAAVSTSVDALALTYGEITYVGFVQLLSYLHSLDYTNRIGSEAEPASCENNEEESTIHLPPQPRQIFYDLGCGSGKALVAAALSGAFLRCVGVELLPSLCVCAETAVERVCSLGSTEAETFCPISVVQGDASSVPLDEAGVVFVSSLCFPDSIMAAILERCAKSRSGMLLCTLQLPTGWEAIFTHEGHVWKSVSELSFFDLCP